jgi:hypothetical protein
MSMLTHLAYINAAVLTSVALAFSWFVLHTKIDEGSTIKAGLVMLILGLGGAAYNLISSVEALTPADLRGLVASITACNLGLLVTAAGILARLRTDPRVMTAAQQITDWGSPPA